MWTWNETIKPFIWKIYFQTNEDFKDLQAPCIRRHNLLLFTLINEHSKHSIKKALDPQGSYQPFSTGTQTYTHTQHKDTEENEFIYWGQQTCGVHILKIWLMIYSMMHVNDTQDSELPTSLKPLFLMLSFLALTKSNNFPYSSLKEGIKKRRTVGWAASALKQCLLSQSLTLYWL